MLSWYGISAAFGVICPLLSIVVIAYLVWSTKKLVERIDDKWKNVKISSSNPNEHRLRAVRVPGERNVMRLQLGSTVSSTSSVHPTKETWLNIQSSLETASPNATERPTMRDLQDMFAPARTQSQEEENTPSTSGVGNEGVYVSGVSIKTPADSSA